MKLILRTATSIAFLLFVYFIEIKSFRRSILCTNLKYNQKQKLHSNHKLLASSKNAWDNLLESLTQFMTPKSIIDDSTKNNLEPKLDLTIYDADINNADLILRKAASDKQVNSDEVINQLLMLEKLMRKKNKLDEGLTSKDTLEQLNGSWRLIFTTGTIDTQKKIGKINYFPIKAVQSFDTTTNTIANGIFIGNYPILRFVGDFEWIGKLRKLEFDFNELYLFGLRISIKKGDAVKIGKQTGLGSEAPISSSSSTTTTSANERKAMFMWISANEEIATARGGGGGLALWKRDLEMQSLA